MNRPLHNTIDWRVYLVTDDDVLGERALIDVVLEAVAGGVGAVQLRKKHASTREFMSAARALQPHLQALNIPLIINDRVDVAWAVGADGVHIGQSDMPYPLARELLGPEALIGISIESLEQLQQAESWDLAYVALSPVFHTPTKTDTLVEWGIAGIRQARALTRHRLLGIGGLNSATVAAPLAAGLEGIAVISAICAAPDPRHAAQDLHQRVTELGYKP